MTLISKKMSVKISTALAIASALLVNQVQAGGIEQFKAFVSSTHAAKGDFIQRQLKVVDGQPKLSKQTSGTFLFSRPGKFIWLYQTPYLLLQADGEKLFMYDKDLNQVSIKSLGTALSSSPAAILFGSNDLEKNFSIKDVGQKDGMDWLQATPKDKDSTFALISIGMQDGVPREMDLRDTFNQTTVILLQNLEKNPGLKPDQFKFVVPAGADVFNPEQPNAR
jgi:outer membrane lipoprotein carrier protein